MEIQMRVWVDPKTRQPSETPIEMVFSDPNSFLKLLESGLDYEPIQEDTSASEPNSYAGKCTLCGDLIRSELELAHIPVKVYDKSRIKIAHRNCVQIFLLTQKGK